MLYYIIYSFTRRIWVWHLPYCSAGTAMSGRRGALPVEQYGVCHTKIQPVKEYIEFVLHVQRCISVIWIRSMTMPGSASYIYWYWSILWCWNKSVQEYNESFSVIFSHIQSYSVIFSHNQSYLVIFDHIQSYWVLFSPIQS